MMFMRICIIYENIPTVMQSQARPVREFKVPDGKYLIFDIA